MAYSMHTHTHTHTHTHWKLMLAGQNTIQEAPASNLDTDIGYNKTFVFFQSFCCWTGTLQYAMSICIQIFSNSPFTKPRAVSMFPDFWKNTATWLNNSAVHTCEISGSLCGVLRPFLFLGIQRPPLQNRTNRMSRNVCSEVPTYAGTTKATRHNYAHLHISRLQVQTGTDKQKFRKWRCLVTRSILPCINCNLRFPGMSPIWPIQCVRI